MDEVVDDPPGQCLGLASPGAGDDSNMPSAAKDGSALSWRQGLGVVQDRLCHLASIHSAIQIAEGQRCIFRFLLA